jgi:hypothetical protein
MCLLYFKTLIPYIRFQAILKSWKIHFQFLTYFYLYWGTIDIHESNITGTNCTGIYDWLAFHDPRTKQLYVTVHYGPK